jgi:hypothetical protein
VLLLLLLLLQEQEVLLGWSWNGKSSLLDGLLTTLQDVALPVDVATLG